MPASLESQLAVLRSQLDKYRDSDLPKVLQSPLAFDARKNLARDASQNRAFLALQEGLLGIITQLSALVVNASSPSQQELKDTLSAEAASLLDVLDGKRESDERSAVSTATTAAATGTAPRTPFFRRPTFTFVAPPRSTSRNTNANNADSSPHSASSASSQPQLDTGTQLALAASELDSLEPKLRSLSSRSLAFEILPGGFLAESLPRVPANDVYHSLFDTLEGVRKRLNAIEIPTGTDRNITNRHSDMLVTCAEMLSRLDAERKRQYAAREAERIAVEVEQLEIREAQERSRTEQDARIAEQRRADQLRAQEQSAKLAADRDRLAEVRRRVEANAVPALGPGPGGLPPIVIPIGSAVSPTPSSIEPRVFDPPTPPPIPPNVQRSASDLEWSSNPYIPPASGINPSTFPRTPVAGASGVSPGSGSGSPYSAANSLAPNNAAYNNRPDPILEALAERERQLAELVERERQESEARERELAARQAQLRALEAERVALEQRKADRERERIEREERIRVLEAERAERERRRIESEQAAQALLAQQQALRAPVMGPPVPPREPSPGIATAAASEEAADALLVGCPTRRARTTCSSLDVI